MVTSSVSPTLRMFVDPQGRHVDERGSVTAHPEGDDVVMQDPTK
jgi:hypothetical protein